MIFLLHGDNITASRQALNQTLDELKVKSPLSEVVHLDGNKLTETELVEAIEAPSMIAPDRVIHIDGLLSRRISKEKNKLIDRLLSSFFPRPSSLFLLLWEPKPLTATQLKPFQKIKDCRIQEYKLNKFLWNFLDNLRPGNSAKLIGLLESTLKTEPAELVMFMLIRRVTELLLATSRDPRALDGVRSPWQKGKLIAQAKHWTEPQLVNFHRRLYEIDEAIKTGATPADLSTHLDILLATL